MTETEQPWSERIALADVPEEGLHIAIEADAAVRHTLARTAGLRDLSRLEASFDLTHKGTGLQVTGEVLAVVGQNCVVTLEPIDKNLHEAIDLLFVSDAAATLGQAEREASFGMTDAEPSEPLFDGVVDLGAIATEYFLLGIDPYPRKDGAVFDAGPSAADKPESPFAALAALKNPPREGSDG